MADIDRHHQAEDSRLRERPSAKPLHARQLSEDDAKQRVLALNEQEDRGHEDGREKRTYGRTPDGTGTDKHCGTTRRQSPPQQLAIANAIVAM
jgi:phosphatidylethanolamine N-methyltransferase